MVSSFQAQAGLRRSIDKIYEILVYALFSTIVRALNVEVTVEIKKRDRKILKDFERFIEMVLGISSEQHKRVMPATMYRVGKTNAADRGLDIWANFGPAIQVKHLTLTSNEVEDIATNIASDKIVIVCIDIEQDIIKNLLSQIGLSERIQGIITIEDLETWYELCLSEKYCGSLGRLLLDDVCREFEEEFPSNEEIVPFLNNRGYNDIKLSADWLLRP